MKNKPKMSVLSVVISMVILLVLVKWRMGPLTINLNDMIGVGTFKFQVIGFLLFYLVALYITFIAVKRDKTNAWNKLGMILNIATLIFIIIIYYTFYSAATH